jgi:hypothetical protein
VTIPSRLQPKPETLNPQPSTLNQFRENTLQASMLQFSNVSPFLFGAFCNNSNTQNNVKTASRNWFKRAHSAIIVIIIRKVL